MSGLHVSPSVCQGIVSCACNRCLKQHNDALLTQVQELSQRLQLLEARQMSLDGSALNWEVAAESSSVWRREWQALTQSFTETHPQGGESHDRLLARMHKEAHDDHQTLQALLRGVPVNGRRLPVSPSQ